MTKFVNDRPLGKPVHQIHGPIQDKVVAEQAAVFEAHRQVFPHPFTPRQQAPMGIEIGFNGGNGCLEGIQFTLRPIPRKCETVQLFHRITT